MKKIILSAIAIFTIGFVNAQKAQFGVKGGLNLAVILGDTDGVDFQSKAGYHVGGFVDIKVSDKISIQPELLYSTQGASVKDFEVELNNTLYSADVNFNLSYINIPVMLKYYAAEKFNLEVGPQIGFLTAAKIVAKVNGNEGEEDAKDIFESVDFGLNLGAGYDFTKKISAGVRYNVGLSNIEKTESGDDSKIKNSVFSLSLGYKF
ncbi:porin family protein [Flavobacterium sp.]|uniref:porin family protein n=1 Tax=Flavobacterium sp. TaxID=239 RepID=UPI00286A1AC6|nr:porin family protein [Flavobacterium sp.]